MNKMILIVLVLLVVLAAGYMFVSQSAFTSSSQISGAVVGISQSLDTVGAALSSIDNLLK